MFRKKWLLVLASLVLVTTACTASLNLGELPGLQALGQQTGVSANLASGTLRRLADRAESKDPSLDVVQIEFNEVGNLVIFVIVNPQAQNGLTAALNAGSSDNPQELVRLAVESLSEATLDIAPDTPNLLIFFMDVRRLATLDRGPALVGRVVGAITFPLEEISNYIQGPRNSDNFQSFLESESVRVSPVDQIYNSSPNHPIRTLEALQ